MPLMTYQEYVEFEHPIPYILTIKHRDAGLYYFGEAHTFDPKHPQWTAHQELWEKFIKESAEGKRVVMVEGGLRKVSSAMSPEESVTDSGGPALSECFALQAGIPCVSPEPPENEERRELEKHFTRDQIQYYYFIRVVAQWHLMPEPIKFEDYIEKFLNADKKYSGWSDYDFSLEHMKRIHADLFGAPFDESDVHHAREQADPTRTATIIQKVAAYQFRDLYIVDKIVGELRAGVSVFAHFGASHPVVQEPLIRELLA